MAETELTAPISAVTVYPERARVTRTGRVRLAGGEQKVVLDGLPVALQTDSVRVSGRGPASVLGVDITKRQHARPTDPAIAGLEEQLRGARKALAALDDEHEVLVERLAFLSGLARRSAGTFARTLASGEADPVLVGELSDALAAQQATLRAERRELEERRQRAGDEIAAIERSLAARRGQRFPDKLAAVISLDVQSEGEIELEVSYVVYGASWHSAYDVRLEDERLTLSWYGLVTQHSGEDWPECDLKLSTARPSDTASVPELHPWFLDRLRPAPPMPPPSPYGAMPMMARAPQPMAAPGAAYGAAADMDAVMDRLEVPLAQVSAAVTQGTTAATYTPARPVAVPADGSANRATVAVIDLGVVLDYVTAPLLSTEAHLRATVTNSSAHTLLPGTAAVFHGPDFIGNSGLPMWAPGEEVELALGVDDRVRVERELVRRTAGRAVLGSTRKREAEHKITVSNHSPAPARITVLDQLPVSRDESIVVKEIRLEPTPAERTDLGIVTWKVRLDPGAKQEFLIGVRVEQGKNVEMTGWRE